MSDKPTVRRNSFHIPVSVTGPRTRTPRVVAAVKFKAPGAWTPEQRTEVAKWLRKAAGELMRDGVKGELPEDGEFTAGCYTLDAAWRLE